MVRVFLVMPDMAPAKIHALCSAGAPDVLVSYSILVWKPVTAERLKAVVERGCVGSVMLDSGAYHHARGEFRVDVDEYASRAWRLAVEGLAEYVVAPDVPGDPKTTLKRTLQFSKAYPGEFIPVAQPPPGPPDPKAHANELQGLALKDLLERAPKVPGGRLVGLGGLDGPRRKTGYLVDLVRKIEDLRLDIKLHLFGVGARLIKSLAARGLLNMVYSIDTGGWLAEIRFRRRTRYRALTTLEANTAAIKGYLERLATATEAH